MQLRTNKVKGLVGPVYQSEDVSHGYSEIQKHVQRFSNLPGSVDLGEDNRSSFDIIERHHFCESKSVFHISVRRVKALIWRDVKVESLRNIVGLFTIQLIQSPTSIR